LGSVFVADRDVAGYMLIHGRILRLNVPLTVDSGMASSGGEVAVPEDEKA